MEVKGGVFRRDTQHQPSRGGSVLLGRTARPCVIPRHEPGGVVSLRDTAALTGHQNGPACPPRSGRAVLSEALCKGRLLQNKVGNPSWLREIARSQNMQSLKASHHRSYSYHS